MKHKCKCGKLATWYYMPAEQEWACCDDCVPRGCSCNCKIDDSGDEPIFLDEEETDEQGRFYPCCEWLYDEEGWNYEPDISLCEHCYCMTYTIDDKCGKCKGEK